MEEPALYLWTFDRNPWDSSTAAETFSVGVYQWIPAASGKLKRSKTIRVCGYTAEPDRVYEKARELCARLDGEGARAENPPAWLRKRYSVPRPENAPPPLPREELTGDQARSVRLEVMKRALLPQGFTKKSGSTYLRVRGEQLHLIDFQGSRWGGEFTVNLGFHYTFVPPYSRGSAGAPQTYRLLDCALSGRLGHFLPEREDTWWAYGGDPERLAAVYEQVASQSVAVVERYADRWQDPAAWLRPELMERLLGEAPWVDGWYLQWPRLFLGAAALRAGHVQTARDLLEPLTRDADRPTVRDAAISLLQA